MLDNSLARDNTAVPSINIVLGEVIAAAPFRATGEVRPLSFRKPYYHLGTPHGFDYTTRLRVTSSINTSLSY